MGGDRSIWRPRCIEQMKALSVFCPLLVVLATELAHRVGDRERRRENWVSTTCSCFWNSER